MKNNGSMRPRMQSSVWLKIYDSWASHPGARLKPHFFRGMGIVIADRVAHAQEHNDFSRLIHDEK